MDPLETNSVSIFDQLSQVAVNSVSTIANAWTAQQVRDINPPKPAFFTLSGTGGAGSDQTILLIGAVVLFFLLRKS